MVSKVEKSALNDVIITTAPSTAGTETNLSPSSNQVPPSSPQTITSTGITSGLSLNKKTIVGSVSGGVNMTQTTNPSSSATSSSSSSSPSSSFCSPQKVTSAPTTIGSPPTADQAVKSINLPSSPSSQSQNNQQQQFPTVTKNDEFVFEVPPEAPVFSPTQEEFQNPLTYISKIRPIAEKYGICKVIPPASWQPPFTLDVDKMRFTPRVQRLNELEAKTRVKLNFLDQIAKFWELQGSCLKIPMVERKPLDLYSLYRAVQEEGGLEQASKERKWSKIACRMGYPQGKSVGTILKGHYERILFPFDIFTTGKAVDLKLEPDSDDRDYQPHGIVSRQQVTPPPETTARRSKRFANQQKPQDIRSHINPTTTTTTTSSSSPTTTPLTSSIKKEQLDEVLLKKEKMSDDEASIKSEIRRYSLNQAFKQFKCEQEKKNRLSQRGKRNQNIDPLAKYICLICNRGDAEEAMLLCDGCDDSYHTFCLMPPLNDIPKGDWRCPKCVVEEVSKPMEAFGFEQAQREYSLHQFGDMADRFKSDYFNMPVNMVPTELVEREFWRIVSSIDEDVTVEYGADLHTMDHGSGFPTKTALYLHSGDQEYAESTWNLNNLPLLEESILGHITADISGMKVPWMYVGMCFATFCWHNEDHWSYSVNYLHWGEPKTWYGVPGSQAESFEETMKSAAPELFASQPDLLHQLVTIMNPNILMNSGVPVYRTDQHSGEFVITFPRAYHAGFNQGYNFAEAVNFAPADWLKMGRECINHYSTLRRFCVFSHDELVCKMALEPDKLNMGIATACYIDMAEMVDSEKKLRKTLLEWGVTKAEREAFELVPDDERQCDSCKTTCFLSAVKCSCTPNLVCLRHYNDLCKCQPDKHTLKYRYTLDELPLMLRKLKTKAESFENWLSKVRDVIDPNTPTTITLHELQQLTQEAEEKKFPNSILLERLNSAVLEAEKCVTVIHQLDINKMRTRTRHSSEYPKYKLTLEELDLFVQEIDNLCCIIEEGQSVRELQMLGKEFVNAAEKVLKEDLNVIDEQIMENLIEEGCSLCIELPQTTALKYRLTQVELYSRIRFARESDDKIPLNTLKQFIEEGISMSPDFILEKELTEIQDIMTVVEEWEANAKRCFESGTQHQIPEIEELLEQAEHIEGNLPSQPMLKDALRKAKEWLATVEILQTNENYPYFHTLENVVNRGRNIPFQLEELKRMQEHLNAAQLWKERTCKTFLKKNSGFTLLDALSPRAEAVMLPSRYRKRNTDEQYYNQQFTEELAPVQMVLAFKKAEEKEIRDIKELRRINAIKNPEDDKYCICRRRFYGTMYHCQLCKDWFHSACVPPPKSTVRTIVNQSVSSAVGLIIPTVSSSGSTAGNITGTTSDIDREVKYLCPSCMRSRRPRLETILSLLVSLQRLPIRLPEGEALQCLTERAMNWQDRARQALAANDVASALAKLSIISQKISDTPLATGSGSNVEKLQRDNKKITKLKQHQQLRKKLQQQQQLLQNKIGKNSDTNSETSTDSDDNNLQNQFRDDTPSGDSSPSAPTNIEHAYSVPSSLLPFGNKFSNISLKSEPPLIVLPKSTKEYLEELMMEGDLLEVSLDETQHLWRILNAAKPSISDLAYIHYRYKIISPNDILVNMKKRKSEGDVQTKKSTKLNRLSDTTLPLTSVVGSGGSVSTIPSTSLIVSSTITTISNVSTTATTATSVSEQLPNGQQGKIKRGRKLKILNETSMNTMKKIKRTTTVSSNDIQNVSGGGGNDKKDKKAQKDTTISDDDEDCSASECVRPAGHEVDWVQCDGGCNKWFHMFCVGLAKSQLKPDEDFICTNCPKNSSTTGTISLTKLTEKSNIEIINNTENDIAEDQDDEEEECDFDVPID